MGGVGCDHATKLGAKAALEGREPLSLVANVLDLRYAENRDTAFSLFQRRDMTAPAGLLLALSCVALALLGAFWWRRRRGGVVEHAGFALVAAGAVGNVLDRAARGYVVDFIHVAHWPVFNVADVAIVLGMGVLFLARRSASHTLAR